MQYPLISEYIEAIRTAEDNMATLNNLRPVLDDKGRPVMSSGNFAVVFKMKSVDTGRCLLLSALSKIRKAVLRRINGFLRSWNSFLLLISYMFSI